MSRFPLRHVRCRARDSCRLPSSGNCDVAPAGGGAAMETIIDSVGEDGVLWVRVSGRLADGNAAEFAGAIAATNYDGVQAVILDCERMSHMDRIGIRAVSMTAMHLRRRGTPSSCCARRSTPCGRAARQRHRQDRSLPSDCGPGAGVRRPLRCTRRRRRASSCSGALPPPLVPARGGSPAARRSAISSSRELNRTRAERRSNLLAHRLRQMGTCHHRHRQSSSDAPEHDSAAGAEVSSPPPPRRAPRPMHRARTCTPRGILKRATRRPARR